MQCVSLSQSYDSQCAWERDEPSEMIFFMYGILIPLLTMFGFIANFLNALVFMRPKLIPSAFTYLAILSWVDCLCCLIILLTSLSRSILFHSTMWIRFDFQWQTPLFGILTGGANWILAAVTLDRMIYLQHGLPQSPPKFCTRRIAKRNIFGIMLMSVILNTPYFFIFVVREDGTFYTTNFYSTKFYRFHNWLSFIVLCIIPGMFLLGGNLVVIIIFRRWMKKHRILGPQSSDYSTIRTHTKYQTKLTLTIITVVFLYLVGELPAHITSRKSALNLLYGGDVSKVHFKAIEQFEVIFLTLNALQLSFNIVIYAVINPIFMTEFFVFLREASDLCLEIMGCITIYKCWNLAKKKLCDKRNAEVSLSEECENRGPSTYRNEAFNRELEFSLEVDLKNYDKWIRQTREKWKSCFDLRLLGLDCEDWSKRGKVLKRQSLPL